MSTTLKMPLTTEVPMSPPLPRRHPARAHTSKESDATSARSLSTEVLDLWEHAAVLYHGFEWQAAAETFLYLSRAIRSAPESTQCLLNAAIVFARLGEFANSAQILAGAEPDDETTALTMFVWGHVEFELGNFEKAKECFQVSLSSLNGPYQHFDHLGLEFTLRASHIQQSLRIFDSSNHLYGFLGTLGALPADGLFEAPTRSRTNSLPSHNARRTSSDSEYVPTLTDASDTSSPALSPVDGMFEDHHDYSAWRSPVQESVAPVVIRQNSDREAIHLRQESLRVVPKQPLPVPAPTQDTDLSEIRKLAARSPHLRPAELQRSISIRNRMQQLRSEDSGSNIKQVQSPPLPENISTRIEIQRPRPTESTSPHAQDNRVQPEELKRNALGRQYQKPVTRPPRPNRLEPRDARLPGNTTKGLADFILKLPSDSRLSPRDATGKVDSTRDLTDWLRSTGNSEELTALPTPSSGYTAPPTDDRSMYSIPSGGNSAEHVHTVTNEELSQLSKFVETFEIPSGPSQGEASGARIVPRRMLSEKDRLGSRFSWSPRASSPASRAPAAAAAHAFQESMIRASSTRKPSPLQPAKSKSAAQPAQKASQESKKSPPPPSQEAVPYSMYFGSRLGAMMSKW